jgi:hypothetical protein
VNFFFSLIGIVAGFRKSDQWSLFQDDSEISDSRIPFPKDIDYEQLMCGEGESSSFLSFRREPVALPPCIQDGDCSEGEKNFCVAGTCSACKSDADCLSDPEFPFCSSHACSACRTDSDCKGTNLICRNVQDSSKQCLPCGDRGVPSNVTLASASSCSDWSCPVDLPVVTSAGTCGVCPTCSSGQFLVPPSEFSRGTPEFFYPNCTGARDPKCIDCPVTETSCSTMVRNDDRIADPSIGQLPPQFPCGAFKCKSNFYLDRTSGKCQTCAYRSCPPGWFLEGCGGGNPGRCVGCPQLIAADNKLDFIDPRDSRFDVTLPMDVCRPMCGDVAGKFYLSRPTPAVGWSCTPCDFGRCKSDQQLTGCGPGNDPGFCSDCPGGPAPPNWHWSSVDLCQLQQCQFDSCAPGTTLMECGDRHLGTCKKCAFELPENAKNWIARFDQIRLQMDTCQIECRSGFFLDDNRCETCQGCGIGQRRVGCRDNSPGWCEDCPPIRDDEYFVNSACETRPCGSCPEGEVRVECGRGSPGICQKTTK